MLIVAFLTEFIVSQFFFVAELKVAFALFDKDGDGCITTAELRSVMKSLGFDTTDKDVTKLIDRFDYDGKLPYLNIISHI